MGKKIIFPHIYLTNFFTRIYYYKANLTQGAKIICVFFIMNILEKLLFKRGIKSVDELSGEEKKTFENWRKILSKDQLTLEDIKMFCQTQINVIETRWKDYGTEQNKKAELIPYHTIYRTLLQVIESPQKERSQLEIQLEQML